MRRSITGQSAHPRSDTDPGERFRAERIGYSPCNDPSAGYIPWRKLDTSPKQSVSTAEFEIIPTPGRRKRAKHDNTGYLEFSGQPTLTP